MFPTDAGKVTLVLPSLSLPASEGLRDAVDESFEGAGQEGGAAVLSYVRRQLCHRLL